MLALICASAAIAQGVSDLKAFYREGQTFLTWKEDSSRSGEWYNVYVSDKPISYVSDAKLIARIPEGSRHFGFFRDKDADFNKKLKLDQESWAKAIQIEDDETNSKQLPEGTGLFVRTIKSKGNSYYAVTVENAVSEKNAVQAGVNSIIQPVSEDVHTPGAILQKKLGKPGDPSLLYAFFTDYEVWNPDGTDDNWEGYVHVFQVKIPTHKDAKEPYPVSFRLHAYTAWGGWNIDYCFPNSHIDCRMLDYHLTWWHGYSDALPKMDGKYAAEGPVVNFTERRILQVAKWLMSNPKNFPAKVDPERVSIFGGSMGGTGTNFVAMRNGDVFASGFADKGINSWALEKKYNIWAVNIWAKCGVPEKKLKTLDGKYIYDVLDIPRMAAEHPEMETPFMDIFNGITDGVIAFKNIVDYFKALEKGKHPFCGAWDMHGHGAWFENSGPMDWKKIRKDEICPAFANASSNTVLRSGFRINAAAEKITEKTVTLKGKISPSSDNENVDGSLPPDLAGKTLVVGPYAAECPKFKIKSSTKDTITIEEGNLLEVFPPPSNYDIQQQAKKLGRELSEEEKKQMSIEKRNNFLVCDGEPRGQWNGLFTWSTSLQNFDPSSKDDDMVDEAKRASICMRLAPYKKIAECKEDFATADLTLRRCRNFKPAPGEKVKWENWDCSDPKNPKKIADGEVSADSNGLVTVPKFQIGRKGWGNKLLLLRK